MSNDELSVGQRMENLISEIEIIRRCAENSAYDDLAMTALRIYNLIEKTYNDKRISENGKHLIFDDIENAVGMARGKVHSRIIEERRSQNDLES